MLSLLLFSVTPEKTNRNHRLSRKFPFTNPLIRSNLRLLFTCSLAVLPVCVCALNFSPHRGYKLEARPQRITVTENHTHLFYIVNTSTHSTLHIYTPCLLICSVLVCLFWFSPVKGLCQSRFEISLTTPKHVSHNRTCRSLGGFGNMAKHCNRQPPP